MYNADSTHEFSVTYNESYTLPTLTREGYTFLGWYNGNTKITSELWGIASNVTITPKWRAN